MATSPNGNNHQLERTELRRAAARARNERQQRIALIGGVVFIVVVAGSLIGMEVGKGRHAAPTAPVSLAPVTTHPPNVAMPPALRPPIVANGMKAIDPPPGGQIVTANVRADKPVTYDPRVIPLLSTSNLPVPLQQPTSIWELRSGFGALPANDGATYASISLGVKTPADTMGQVARSIVAANPTASVKFVVRLDTSPATGVLRVALDNKRQHAAWIKKRGDSAGTPYVWWKAPAAPAPAAPRAAILAPTVH